MKPYRQGFTLTEVLIAMGILGLVVAGGLSLYLLQQRAWRATELDIAAAHEANMALYRMVYGAGGRRGLRTAKEVSINASSDGWTLSYETPTQANQIEFVESESRMLLHPGGEVVGRDITEASAIVSQGRVRIAVTSAARRGRLQSAYTAVTEVRPRNQR